MRKGFIKRDTLETRIQTAINLDPGEPEISISTGFAFADHMLELMSHWAGFSLDVQCQGDMQVDAHHSLEDAGICLGQALEQALAGKQGISRCGWARVPMDEALAEVSVDISGRPYLVYQGSRLLNETIAGQEKDLWREFFKSFAFNARMNLHINLAYGSNSHHLLESAFKSTGLALKQAVFISKTGILSTKGTLD
ncbi:MAG: imidazoleglycerol-phosphate dehydratase HisB [Desulfonatronovibrionaceae bacterium]